jgi:serine/threonine protein kinase
MSSSGPIVASRIEQLGFGLPKTFGKFVIRGPLGHGGMGIVLDAVAPDGLAVALKLIRPTGDSEKREMFAARLGREARVLKRLAHPGVVKLVDYGTVDDVVYLAMERIEGKSLGVLLQRGPMEADLVISIGVRIGETLAHLHQIDIVHRDIKPDNVIIDKDGNPILTDFGLARLSGATAITRRDELVGSLGYIAPEIVEGAEPSPKTDQYALGRLLINLAQGEPAKAPEGTPILEQLAQSMRVDWSKYPTSGIFPALGWTLRRMIRTKPENRFDDMYTCIVELETHFPRAEDVDEEMDQDPTVRGSVAGDALLGETSPGQIPVPKVMSIVGQGAPRSDWSVPPEGKAPGGENWEDDTKYNPAAALEAFVEHKAPSPKAPWLATDLGAPAALPSANTGLEFADPNSENNAFLSLSAAVPVVKDQEAQTLPPEAPEDAVSSAADTGDLIVKMRRRKQLYWQVVEDSKELDKIERLKRQSKAFWESKLQDAPALAPGEERDPLDAWKHIVGDLLAPTPRSIGLLADEPDTAPGEAAERITSGDSFPLVKHVDPTEEVTDSGVPYPPPPSPAPAIVVEHVALAEPERKDPSSHVTERMKRTGTKLLMLYASGGLAVGFSLALGISHLLHERPGDGPRVPSRSGAVTKPSPGLVYAYEGAGPPSEVDSEAARALLKQAQRRMESDDIDEAQSMLGVCIRLADIPDCHRLLGDALFTRDRAAAHAHYERFLATTDRPRSEEADAVRRKLVDLNP